MDPKSWGESHTVNCAVAGTATRLVSKLKAPKKQRKTAFAPISSPSKAKTGIVAQDRPGRVAPQIYPSNLLPSEPSVKAVIYPVS